MIHLNVCMTVSELFRCCASNLNFLCTYSTCAVGAYFRNRISLRKFRFYQHVVRPPRGCSGLVSGRPNKFKVDVVLRRDQRALHKISHREWRYTKALRQVSPDIFVLKLISSGCVNCVFIRVYDLWRGKARRSFRWPAGAWLVCRNTWRLHLVWIVRPRLDVTRGVVYLDICFERLHTIQGSLRMAYNRGGCSDVTWLSYMTVHVPKVGAWSTRLQKPEAWYLKAGCATLHVDLLNEKATIHMTKLISTCEHWSQRIRPMSKLRDLCEPL